MYETPSTLLLTQSNHILNVVTPLVHDFCCILMCMLYLYCVCYVVFIYRACCVVLSCMSYCTYSYVCICVLWQGRTALADCPEFKLLIKSNQSNQQPNINGVLTMLTILKEYEYAVVKSQ